MRQQKSNTFRLSLVRCVIRNDSCTHRRGRSCRSEEVWCYTLTLQCVCESPRFQRRFDQGWVVAHRILRGDTCRARVTFARARARAIAMNACSDCAQAPHFDDLYHTVYARESLDGIEEALNSGQQIAFAREHDRRAIICSFRLMWYVRRMRLHANVRSVAAGALKSYCNRIVHILDDPRTT